MNLFSKQTLYDIFLDKGESIDDNLKKSKYFFGVKNDGVSSFYKNSSIIYLYIISEIYSLPIELYYVDNNIRAEVTEITSDKLLFITLINGYILKPVIKLCFSPDGYLGIIEDIKDKKKKVNLKNQGEYEIIFNENEFKRNGISKEDIFKRVYFNKKTTSENYSLNELEEKIFNLYELLNPNFFTALDKIFLFENLKLDDHHGRGRTYYLFLYSVSRSSDIFASNLKSKEYIELLNSANMSDFSKALSIIEINSSSDFNKDLLVKLFNYTFLNFFYDVETLEPLNEAEIERQMVVSNLNVNFTVQVLFCLLFAFQLGNRETDLVDLNKYLVEGRTTEVDNYITNNNIIEVFKNGFVSNNKDKIKACVVTENNYERILKQNKKIVAEQIDLIKDKYQYLNPTFIIKLISFYGANQTFDLLKGFLPEMFNYEKNRTEIKNILVKIQDADAGQDYFNDLWALVSVNFLKKFKSEVDLVSYDPFQEYNNYYSKYEVVKKSLKDEIRETSKLLKKINFDLIKYDNQYRILPVLSNIMKLTEFIKTKTSKFIDYCIPSTFKIKYLEKIQNYILLSSFSNQDEDYIPSTDLVSKNNTISKFFPYSMLKSLCYGIHQFKEYFPIFKVLTSKNAFSQFIEELISGTVNTSAYLASLSMKLGGYALKAGGLAIASVGLAGLAYGAYIAPTLAPSTVSYGLFGATVVEGGALGFWPWMQGAISSAGSTAYAWMGSAVSTLQSIIMFPINYAASYITTSLAVSPALATTLSVLGIMGALLIGTYCVYKIYKKYYNSNALDTLNDFADIEVLKSDDLSDEIKLSSKFYLPYKINNISHQKLSQSTVTNYSQFLIKLEQKLKLMVVEYQNFNFKSLYDEKFASNIILLTKKGGEDLTDKTKDVEKKNEALMKENKLLLPFEELVTKYKEFYNKRLTDNASTLKILDPSETTALDRYCAMYGIKIKNDTDYKQFATLYNRIITYEKAYNDAKKDLLTYENELKIVKEKELIILDDFNYF